jgi:polyisoprenoid-binding protein YceI
VNEQLADRQLPSDAVLTTDKVSGTFTLLPDGTFTPDSGITVDLTALASDNGLRDNTVKRSVLQTSQFPEATFVPTTSQGFPSPLPASGQVAFTITGHMTIHGVTRDVSFTGTCAKSDADVQVAANAAPALTFGQFGMTQPRVFTVISIKDEIRLEVDLVATQKA